LISHPHAAPRLPQGKRWLALIQLLADLRSGTEPKNLRPDFLALTTAVEDDSPDTVAGNACAFSSAYGRHEDFEAARSLETCLRYAGSAPPGMREALIADAASFQAKRRKRMDLAQQWFADLPEKTILPEIRIMAEAAILEGQGDIQGALKKLDEAEKVIVSQATPDRRDLSLRSLKRSRDELLKQHLPILTADES
jgi:hypothetical protein